MISSTACEGSHLQDKVFVALASVGGLPVQLGMCSLGVKFSRGLNAGISRMDPPYYIELLLRHVQAGASVRSFWRGWCQKEFQKATHVPSPKEELLNPKQTLNPKP